MRIWDVPPAELCRLHLLGEHRELHAIWSILVNDKKGYRNHPEVQRWQGKRAALYRRHAMLVEEMRRRGYRHCSPLDSSEATGEVTQDCYVDTLAVQRRLLRDKPCDCLRKI
ncbi:MAG: pyrimidine dimer DNA glycosylase/endonuclease V [Thermoplasmatota archaeon]